MASDSPEIVKHPDTIRDVHNVVEKIKILKSGKLGPIVVALDGRSGTGKSTLAKQIAAQVQGITVETDDFWIGGTNEEWDARTPMERAEQAIDWRRIRKEVLEPLLSGQAASWYPFDFKKGSGLSEQAITKGPSGVIILDGAYSARPELEDLIDLKVLVEVPDDKGRRDRLVNREGQEYMSDWHSRWDPAEDYYFTKLRPKSSFGMFITNH